MKKNINIKTISNDYQDKVIALIIPIQQIEFEVPVTLEGQPDLLNIEEYYYTNGGAFWAAELDGEVIGTISLMATGHRAGALRKMFVKKEFRGKEFGVAKLLLNTLLDYCRTQGIWNIYLGTVDILKAAHRFYEKSGFQEVEVGNLPPYFPRMMADNKFYHLSLESENQATI